MPQRDLFSDTSDVDRQKKIQKVKEIWNKKYGKELIVSVTDLQLHKKASTSLDFLESFVAS